jgi:ribosome-binding factor A
MTDRESARDRARLARTTELIAHEAALFIKEAAGSDSLITVTRALASSKGDRVTVFVSVFPEAKEDQAFAFLARQREAFSDHLKSRARVGPLPRVDFELDRGEKNRRRLEELGGQ